MADDQAASPTRTPSSPSGYTSLQRALSHNLPSALHQAQRANRGALLALARRAKVGR